MVQRVRWTTARRVCDRKCGEVACVAEDLVWAERDERFLGVGAQGFRSSERASVFSRWSRRVTRSKRGI